MMGTTLITNAEVFRAGDYGPKGNYTVEDIKAMAADYDPNYHKAPVVTDHKDDGPALGWVEALRVRGDVLCADVRVDSEFAAGVKEQRWPKRSVAVYRQFEKTKRPHLRHLSFLGAGIPAVKGLGDIHFSDAGACELIEFEEKAEVKKTENNKEYPEAAFAYTPDVNDPTTWRLRTWASPETKTTRDMLGRAVATFASEVPVQHQPTVRAKLRLAYKSLGVSQDDMPDAIKESGGLRGFASESYALDESAFSESGPDNEFVIRIVRPGITEDRRREYKVETLKRDFRVYEGAKMFADHPTATEERERPERSIKQWVGNLRNVYVDTDGVIRGTAVIIENWLKDKLHNLRAAKLLGEMRNSHRIYVKYCNEFADKPQIVDRIVKCLSVDFVTSDNAGGYVEYGEDLWRTDIDMMTEDEIKTRRPDLFVAVEDFKESEKGKMAEEKQIEKMTEEITALKTANAKLEEDAKKLGHEKAVAETLKKIDETLAGVKPPLPAPTAARIRAAFTDKESADGLDQLIKEAQAEVAAIQEAGKVQGLGPTEPQKVQNEKADAEKAMFADVLKTTHIRAGMKPEQAEQLARTAANLR